MRVVCLRRSMRWLERLVVMAVVMAVSGALTACSPGGGENENFAYADSAFSTTVRGTFTRTTPDGYTGDPGRVGETRTGVPQAVAATVAVGAPREDGGRDMTVTFIEPPTLSGMTVTAVTDAAGESVTAGQRRVTVTYPSAYGCLVWTDTAGTAGVFDALLRFGEALVPRGDTVSVSPVTDGQHTVTRCVSDGSGGVSATVVFTFAAERMLPVCVTVETAKERLELYVGE